MKLKIRTRKCTHWGDCLFKGTAGSSCLYNIGILFSPQTCIHRVLTHIFMLWVIFISYATVFYFSISSHHFTTSFTFQVGFSTNVSHAAVLKAAVGFCLGKSGLCSKLVYRTLCEIPNDPFCPNQALWILQ